MALANTVGACSLLLPQKNHINFLQIFLGVLIVLNNKEEI